MQTTASAAAKRHLGPIKTQIRKLTSLHSLSNEMIVSNEITGSEKQVPILSLRIKTGAQSTTAPARVFWVWLGDLEAF